MEEKGCLIFNTMDLHQKHFNQCIHNTIGCHGSLENFPVDFGIMQNIMFSFSCGLQLSYHPVQMIVYNMCSKIHLLCSVFMVHFSFFTFLSPKCCLFLVLICV